MHFFWILVKEIAEAVLEKRYETDSDFEVELLDQKKYWLKLQKCCLIK